MVTRSKTAPELLISPRLAAALGIVGYEGGAATLPLSALPSSYAEAVFIGLEYIGSDIPENKHVLTCEACGQRGEYDLGKVILHPEPFHLISNPPAGVVDEVKNLAQSVLDVDGHFQVTGYFRCKHCGGGEWSFGDEFKIFLMAAILESSMTGFGDASVVQFARNQLFDGYEPKSATDSEEHLLELIEQKPEDAFLWNRLGNVYRSGGAHELSVVAFEQSLRYDTAQVESHGSIATILQQIGALKASIHHAHLALAHARFYKKLNPPRLHQMICALLSNVLDASMALDDTDMFLPPRELMEAVAVQHGKPVRRSGGREEYSYDLVSGAPDSFADLADVYVGSRGSSRTQSGSRHHKKQKRKR